MFSLDFYTQSRFLIEGDYLVTTSQIACISCVESHQHLIMGSIYQFESPQKHLRQSTNYTQWERSPYTTRHDITTKCHSLQWQQSSSRHSYGSMTWITMSITGNKFSKEITKKSTCIGLGFSEVWLPRVCLLLPGNIHIDSVINTRRNEKKNGDTQF